MKISVALCTYNGSRFLREQLESIAHQSRLPDEIVIVDDGSTDESVTIANEFAKTSLVSVAIHANDVNLGSTRNFARAIKLCSGDVIALSDQDDVWLPKKLERISTEFNSDPRVGMVFSNAMLADERLSPIGGNLWRESFRPRDRFAFSQGQATDVLLQYNVVTGATMAFRAALKPAILPIPILAEFIHDGWIALIAAMCSRVVALPENLINYRQHSEQQLGAGLSRWQIPRSERYRLTIADRELAIARLENFRHIFDLSFLELMRSVAPAPQLVPTLERFTHMLEQTSQRIEKHIAHIAARADLSEPRPYRLRRVIREMKTGRYEEFSRGWQSALLDLVRK